jgi:uncharacterized paraquat-inducible protein A
MPIIFACQCRSTIEVPKTARGGQVRCPRCGVIVRVPLASDPRHATHRRPGPSPARPAEPS